MPSTPDDPARGVEGVRELCATAGVGLAEVDNLLHGTTVATNIVLTHPGAEVGTHPRFADFFYYAVSTSFIAPPVDIVAHTRGARAATMIEMLSGLALVTVYLSSFIDWQRGSGRKPEEEAAPGIRAQESQTDQ